MKNNEMKKAVAKVESVKVESGLLDKIFSITVKDAHEDKDGKKIPRKTSVKFFLPERTVKTENGETAVSYTWTAEKRFTLPKNVRADSERLFSLSMVLYIMGELKKSYVSIIDGLDKVDEKTPKQVEILTDSKILLSMVEKALVSINEEFSGDVSPLAKICTYVCMNGKISLTLSLMAWVKPTSELAADAYNALLSLMNGNSVKLDDTQTARITASKDALKESFADYCKESTLYDGFKLSVSNKDLVDFIFFASPKKSDSKSEITTKFRASINNQSPTNNLKLYISKWFLKKVRSGVDGE